MEEEDISKILKTYKNKYPYPETWWSKAHFNKRCIEIYTIEQLVIKCLDSPGKEVKDIIEDYILTIMFLKRDTDNIKNIQSFNIMEETLNKMYNILS